jgi:hypothetical protein
MGHCAMSSRRVQVRADSKAVCAGWVPWTT